MARIGYARVSTRGQNEASQVDELKAAGCERVFTDKASGKLASRPEWDACLAYLRQGDVLVITRLSRAARNIRHLLEVADSLRERGIDLIVIKQALDTTTPAGRLMFHIMASIDEFQRELIVEGTLEGLAAARARGRKGGRKPVLTPEQVSLAVQLYDAKTHSVQAIADLLKCSRPTVYKAIEGSRKVAVPA
jgi:DNA invertase Pin-like site-specific DNA recombinase